MQRYAQLWGKALHLRRQKKKSDILLSSETYPFSAQPVDARSPEHSSGTRSTGGSRTKSVKGRQELEDTDTPTTSSSRHTSASSKSRDRERGGDREHRGDRDRDRPSTSSSSSTRDREREREKERAEHRERDEKDRHKLDDPVKMAAKISQLQSDLKEREMDIRVRLQIPFLRWK